MKNITGSRRNLLKAGTSSLIGGLLAGAGRVVGASEVAPGGSGYASPVAPLAASAGMRLATCALGAAGTPSLVVVLDDGTMVDVTAEAVRQKIALPASPDPMLELIKRGNPGLAQLRTLVERAVQRKSGLLPLAQARFLSPIPRPERNIYCVGWNYLDHFEEGKQARADKTVDKLPDHPVFFTKGTHTMNGPFDPIEQVPDNSVQTDWEAELAVIIGQRGRDIPEDQAMQYVFGYAAYNDTTARDIQQKRHGGQWFKGKSLDGHGPMGPWIVTAGALKLADVRVICRVNGIEKQNASYQQMYFKIPRIIAELSRGMTLEAGDIIATGTPAGVGFARKPQEFLKDGDVMETEITGVGVMRNTIRARG